MLGMKPTLAILAASRLASPPLDRSLQKALVLLLGDHLRK